MAYLNDDMIKSCLDKMHLPAPDHPGEYQERFDTAWLNILQMYFPLRKKFLLERESFVSDPRIDKSRANVLVTNLRQGNQHKVIIVEAKPFPQGALPEWELRYDWGAVKHQLQLNMIKAREEFGFVQTMYGIVAVGDRVRFYQMNVTNNPEGDLDPFLPNPRVQCQHVDPILNIHDDNRLIEDTLQSISGLIQSGNNTH